MATDYVINPDRFKTFFDDLETRKNLLTTITDLHKTLVTHFTSLDQALTLKSKTLDTQIDSFNAHKTKTLESLQNRENAIPERESTLAARVGELKASAIADIEGGAGGGGVEEGNLSERLRVFFRRMDSSGLMRFLLAKRKESVALRSEMAEAVGEAVDLLGFVVDALEEFVGVKVEGKVGLADRRWACGILIQAALPLDQKKGEFREGVSGKLKERAAGVLEKWKGVLGGGEGSSGVGAGEATMFLQMVVGFGLKDKFDEEFLRNLVVEFATRRDMAKLAVALGFGDNMGDIIDELVKGGKEIEAVYFASESGLTQRFPPVNLLKSCLTNCRKVANTISKSGHHNSSAVEEANNSELNAVRSIIKCVEDNKLESQFTIDSLKKRVTVLEKAKTDKKKTAAASTTSKPSNKRVHVGTVRGGGGGGGGGGSSSFRPPKAGRFSNTAPASRQRNPPPAARYVAAPTYSYQRSSVYEGPTAASYGGTAYGGVRTQIPSVYEGPTAASYGGAAYGVAHTRSPVGLAQQYGYPPPDVGTAGPRSGASYGVQGPYAGQSNYGAYDYGNTPAAAAAATPSYPPATYKL